jgi:hypothetical protein
MFWLNTLPFWLGIFFDKITLEQQPTAAEERIKCISSLKPQGNNFFNYSNYWERMERKITTIKSTIVGLLFFAVYIIILIG